MNTSPLLIAQNTDATTHNRMDSCIVSLGKIGDVLSVISRLHHGSNLVISKRYATIAQGIPGITPHIYEGEWDDLEGAIKWAKRKFKRVLVPQTFGKDIPIRHLTPGFQHDQWLRMGAVEKNGSQPIQIPRPKNDEGLVGRYVAQILVADHSQSSPFEHREDLWKTINEQFGKTHTITRLSEVKLYDFKDFLCLYDKAECLVSIDTAFLHLSAFSTVPTIALAADKPQSWHGSSDTGRFRFYCRYSEYQSRKDELIAAIKEAKPRIETTPIKTAHPFGYNGSIIEHKGVRYMAYRFHPDSTKWRTQLALIELGDTWRRETDIRVPESLAAESWEDPRLFIYKDKPHIGYVVSKCTAKAGSITPCVSGYGELVFKDGAWSIAEHIQPKYGKNDFTSTEKNFCYFTQGGQLYCIYACSPDHIVLQLDKDVVVKEFKTKAPICSFGAMRGGTQPIQHKGLWLRFAHTHFNRLGVVPEHQYNLTALMMESTPPFSIVSVSKKPIMVGDDRYYYGHKFYKQRIVIPHGAVKNGDSFDVSLGINDSAVMVAHLKESDLNL